MECNLNTAKILRGKKRTPTLYQQSSENKGCSYFLLRKEF